MLIYGRPPCSVCTNRRACVWALVIKMCLQQRKLFFCACLCHVSVHLCFVQPSCYEWGWGGVGGLVGCRNEAFAIQKLTHCERASLSSLSFLLSFLKNTEWMLELLKASHHIPLPSPHVFHSCFWLCCYLKQRLILCEHMINSWERLMPSLQFFLTVVSFSGEIDDTTLLSSVSVSLRVLLLWITNLFSEARVWARWAFQLNIHHTDSGGHTISFMSFLKWGLSDWQAKCQKDC